MIDIKAMNHAVSAHSNVNHLYNGNPYSVHLFMVVAYGLKFKHILNDWLVSDVIAACWLHDTIEDARLTYNDIKKVFGSNVADIVYAVTNDKGKNRSERAGKNYYDGIRDNDCAIFVKICDRLANVEYSKQSKSSMFEVYKKENKDFLENMFPYYMERYNPLIEELKSKFESAE